MKKNKKLIIVVIIVLAILAVAAWYFFFRTKAARKDDACPEGQTGTYPDCVCAAGYSGTPPDCVAIPNVCPEGTIGTFPDCVCPYGTTGTSPNCIPDKVCPHGTSGTPGNCIPDKDCPAGSTGIYPRCTLDVVDANAFFEDGLLGARQTVTNNSQLTATQKADAINIINIDVPKNKLLIIAVAANEGGIVKVILDNAERFYLGKFGVPISLRPTFVVTGGPTGEVSEQGTYST